MQQKLINVNCTFSPTLLHPKNTCANNNIIVKDDSNIHDALYNHAQILLEKKEMMQDNNKLKECTFSPQVTKKAHQHSSLSQKESVNRIIGSNHKIKQQQLQVKLYSSG